MTKREFAASADGQTLVAVKCRKCGGQTLTKKYRLPLVKKSGIVCRVCRSKTASDTLKAVRARQTPEERTTHARHARACIDKASASAAVRKQWETIRSNPDKMKEVSAARSRRSTEMWARYSYDTRKRILDALIAANRYGRSKLSDNFKAAMETAGIYSGFLSEQHFHGFYPDEINHDLRIIVEVYGDVYHCNPRRYKNPDEYVTHIQRTVGEQWLRDRRRLACFYRHGYTVVVAWEQDIRSNITKEIERVRHEIDRKEVARQAA